MQYRKFGHLDWQPSALGFGCMRLPTLDGNPMSGNINEVKAIEMIRYAIDQGINYIDTAYPYHNRNSEIVVGKALRDGYREKVKLATKSPIWLLKKAEDFDNILNEQLTKLQTEQIDFYLLHSLNKGSWQKILDLKLLERAVQAKQSGKIKQLGFSFHDDYEVFEKIVDSYDQWDFCQIQYNYMDTKHQAGQKGLHYAASKGLAVVIMEPLLGGKLANPPQSIQDIFNNHTEKHSPAEWALQWVWNQPEVSLLLSGMSTMDQVKQNIQSAERSGVNSLSAADQDLIERVCAKYRQKTAIPCTGCNYCMPCPNNVEISKNIKLYNDGFMHDDPNTSRGMYHHFMAEANRAGNCVQCKICEEKCPQQIPISEWMPKVHNVLGEGKAYD